MASSTISLSLASLSSLVSGLATTVVVARFVRMEDFGTFVLIQVVASFLGQMTGLGLEYAAARLLATSTEDERRNTVVGTALFLRLATLVTAMPLAWFGRGFLGTILGASATPAAMALVPFLLFGEGLLSQLRSFLQGLFLFRRLAAVDLTVSVLGLGLLVPAVLTGRTDTLVLVGVRVLALGVACTLAAMAVVRHMRLKADRGVAKELLRFGLPLQVNTFLTFIFSRGDTMLIGMLMGPADTALYEVARRIPDSLRRLFEAYQSVYYPHLSRLIDTGQSRRAEKLIHNSLRLTAFATSLLAAGSLLLGGEVIRILFSETYAMGGPALTALTLSLSLSLVSGLLGNAVVASGDSTKPAMVNLVHAPIGLLGLWVLIPPMGVTGAGVANLLGPAVTNPLNLYFLRRRGLDVKAWPYLKPWLLFALWTAVAVAVRPSGWIPKLALTAAYALAGLAVGVVTTGDIAGLVNALGGDRVGIPFRRAWAALRRL